MYFGLNVNELKMVYYFVGLLLLLNPDMLLPPSPRTSFIRSFLLPPLDSVNMLPPLDPSLFVTPSPFFPFDSVYLLPPLLLTQRISYLPLIQCKDKQLGAIKQLTSALREMNYHSIADAVFDCHQGHKEFTPDCVSHDELFARVAVKN